MREETRMYWRVVDGITALLAEYDPMGLEPGQPDGAPADEYSIEAGPLAARLIRKGTVTLEDLDEVWRKFFEQDLTGGMASEREIELLDRTNALLTDDGAAPR